MEGPKYPEAPGPKLARGCQLVEVGGGSPDVPPSRLDRRFKGPFNTTEPAATLMTLAARGTRICSARLQTGDIFYRSFGGASCNAGNAIASATATR